jgi:hypothetical protein
MHCWTRILPLYRVVHSVLGASVDKLSTFCLNCHILQIVKAYRDFNTDAIDYTKLLLIFFRIYGK